MTTVDKNPADLVVRKSVLVNAPQAHAFAVFTEQHGAWWPLNTNHIGADPAQTAIIEPRVGGRWFERSSDGVECDWGRVLAWEPPHRIVLSWDIGADWQYDPTLGTEVEVRFISDGPDTTRVELEHRRLERYGAQAETMQATFDSERGWGGILRGFAQAAEKA
ncbi:MAG: ATPase [Chloroflexi bacterium]|nr:ATPase [Chloroflexota bacterium]